MKPELLANVTTATLPVGSGDLLGVMVIVTVCAVLAVLVWLSLTRNWSFEATANLMLAIMLVLLVEEAVAAYLMLRWKQSETLPKIPPTIQQSSKSSEIGYLHAQSVPWNPAHQTKAMPPQSPLVNLGKNDAPANLNHDSRYAQLSTRRVSFLCKFYRSCDDTQMRPNSSSIEISRSIRFHGFDLKPSVSLCQ